MSTAFGEKLRSLREERKLSRRGLEDESGISQREIAYLEKGRDPRLGTVVALAQVLGAELIEAAFPDHVVAIGRSNKLPTPDKLARAIRGMSPETFDLTAVGG